MSTLKSWGLLAQYENPAQIYHAAEKVADAGYTEWDCCTPFCVHGLDKVMKVKPTILPWLSLSGGLAGGSGGLAAMVYLSAVEYPLNIGGKPLASVPAFIPITFELTVLFACFATFFGLWILCRLPQLYHPAFRSKRFERVTDDKFFIMIETADPKFDAAKTRALLEKTGASFIEELED